VLRNAWIGWTLFFGFGWLVRCWWLSPDPVGLAEYFVRGVCVSAVCVGIVAVRGIDRERR
jgi:hypothetical protein